MSYAHERSSPRSTRIHHTHPTKTTVRIIPSHPLSSPRGRSGSATALSILDTCSNKSLAFFILTILHHLLIKNRQFCLSTGLSRYLAAKTRDEARARGDEGGSRRFFFILPYVTMERHEFNLNQKYIYLLLNIIHLRDIENALFLALLMINLQKVRKYHKNSS